MKKKRSGPDGKFQIIKRTPKGVKGPPKKKPLQPWHEIKDQLKCP